MDLGADHLRRVQLCWLDGGGDSEVLRTCLSIVSGYSSVEDLQIRCDTPGEHSLVAESLCSECCSFKPGGHYLL